ncbi:E3 ubiquitin-protein ligase NRDP1-like [Oppia nitens]|uniref:E3 ubiquitin-protein ligase NRDP1-like n=1 Tax=Oppia nitens TaxID=1686743 RepID=UPI0023D98EAF|nr:E3 ubiquitin-protein ligase NRDP1-like [Oppia nitens]
MPGLCKTRVINVSPKELDELSCTICSAIYLNPVVSQCCQQLYCKTCITRHDNCVLDDCQQLKSQSFSIQTKQLLQLLHSLKVRCDYHMNGCKSVIKLNELLPHRDVCHFKERPVESPHNCNGCDEYVVNGQKKQHEDSCVKALKRKINTIDFHNKRLRIENGKVKSQLEIYKLIANSSDQIETYDYTGTYKLISSINHDQILKLLGATQSAIESWKSKTHTLVINKFSETYCLATSDGTSDHKLMFRLGQVCKETERDGSVSRLLVIADQNKLIETKENSKKKFKIVREFVDNQQKVRTFIDGIVSLRVYDRVEPTKETIN